LIPGPLTAAGLNLLAGPVEVPLELRIPSLQLSAPVLGVGITPDNVMSVPLGPSGDPLWQQVFWYRGSGIPGDSGTATFAGHVDDVRGRPAVFARIEELRPGDRIVVRDTRSGRDVLFLITETRLYTLREAADPSVLARVYGAGPVAGQGPQPAPDGRSHLTLITCAGDFVAGSYDHRFVVYATQAR
jgi:sortase (surface protein transpeptidase)